MKEHGKDKGLKKRLIWLVAERGGGYGKGEDDPLYTMLGALLYHKISEETMELSQT